jgi:hypothetical protein
MVKTLNGVLHADEYWRQTCLFLKQFTDYGAWKINGKTTYLRRKCFVWSSSTMVARRQMMINTEIETLAERTRQWRRLFCPCFNWIRRHIGTNMPEAQFWDYKRNDQRSYSTCDPRGIAYQVYDLAKSMEADFGEKERIKSRWRSSSK